MIGQLSWRWLVWIALLIGAALLLVFDKPATEPANVAPAAATVRALETSASPQPSDGRALDKQDAADRTPSAGPGEPVDRSVLYGATTTGRAVRDLFAAAAWTPPEPVPRPIATAPPSGEPSPGQPLNVIGKKLEDGRWEVFLTRGTSTLIAREGEVLDGDFRVDRISPPDMLVTRLSTGQLLTLGIGEAR